MTSEIDRYLKRLFPDQGRGLQWCTYIGTDRRTVFVAATGWTWRVQRLAGSLIGFTAGEGMTIRRVGTFREEWTIRIPADTH